MKRKLMFLTSACMTMTILLSVPVSASVPSTPIPTSNSSDTSVKEKDVLPHGNVVDENRKVEIINSINEAMDEVLNYDYTSEFYVESAEGFNRVNSIGVVDIENNESVVDMDIMGNNAKSFIKGGKKFISDIRTGGYKFSALTENDNFRNSLKFKKNASKYVVVEELADGNGYIVKNDSFIPLSQLSEIIGNPVEAGNTQAGAAEPIAQIFYEIGNDFRFKKTMVAVLIPAPDGLLISRSVTKTSYSNFNEADEITFPDELESAEQIETTQGPTTSIPAE